MPRKKADAVLTEQSIFSAIMHQLGGVPDYTVADWDPDMQKFGQAILEIAAKGACVFIRAGSGGQSLGISIWEGEVRHPAKYLQDADGVNAWSEAVLTATSQQKAVTAQVRAIK